MKVPAQLTGASFSKDGGMRITFRTNELTPEQEKEVREAFQDFGDLTFDVTAENIN